MRFLCLGNSLTAGFPGYDPAPDGFSNGYGNYKSQYQYWLKRLCIEHLEENLGSLDDDLLNNLIFINRGIPGEVTSSLLRRCSAEILSIKPKPDYIIIIEGTNDLGWGLPNEKIFNNLEEIHKISKSFGISSIGATIPPIRTEQSAISYNTKKVALNEVLISFFENNKIPFADLYHGMMDNNGNLKERFTIMDGLHFSVEGYKQMGAVIFYDTIKEIIEYKYF